MPTENMMFGLSRATCAVLTAVVALVALPAAAQAAATSSSTTTTTVASSTTTLPTGGVGSDVPANGASTAPAPPGAVSPPTTVPPKLPPPPPFALPPDFGYEAVAQLQASQADLKRANPELAPARQRAAAAKKQDLAVQGQVAKLDAQARRTERQLADTRARLSQAAVEAYMHAGSGELVAAVSAVLSPQSAVDIGSELHVIGTYGSSAKSALDDYVTLKREVDEQRAAAAEVADRADQNLDAANRHLTDVENKIAQDKASIMAATKGIAEFQAAATSASSPILGPSRLTAKQMADFVVATGGHPRITVPLVELAQDYLDEGVATGVRGDVAFAQSILETGSFANPGAAATDNNFAGIGWCDSCAHGYDFVDARTGVRAQLQLLRIYVDPKFPEPTYKDPILLAGSLKLGFRGKVQTWWDLWGTWATGALYGQRVYDIYDRMVAFSLIDPTPSTPVLRAPPATAPTPPTNAVTRPPGTGPGTKKP